MKTDIDIENVEKLDSEEQGKIIKKLSLRFDKLLDEMKLIAGDMRRLSGSSKRYEKKPYNEVRKFAILEQVYRENGVVTPEELSEIAKSVGRKPQGLAGFFKNPGAVMEQSVNNTRRLTKRGEKIVVDARERYGNDFLEKIQDELYNAGEVDEYTSTVVLEIVNDADFTFMPITKDDGDDDD